MKNKFIWYFGIFSLAGGILTSWMAPKLIAYWFEPPVQMAVTCHQAIEWALGKLQILQLVGTGLGGAFGVFLYFFMGRKKEDDFTA